MPEWIKNCQMCNDGIVIGVNALMAKGKSETKACRIMAATAAKAYPELGSDFSEANIKGRYRYHKNGKVFKYRIKADKFTAVQVSAMEPTRLDDYLEGAFFGRIIALEERIGELVRRKSEIDPRGGKLERAMDLLIDRINEFIDV